MQTANERHALMVVDMQRYYIEAESSFCRYFEHIHPGAMQYIGERCRKLVTPNIQALLQHARNSDIPCLFLRLCGKELDRSDLHSAFRTSYDRAARRGFPDSYPLESDPWSDVIPEIRPLPQEAVFCKTTFSGFTHGKSLEEWLERQQVTTLVMTGLATSQCVETTARDGSERGFSIIHIQDAQADYEELLHRASLISSQGVCGGCILGAEQYCSYPPHFSLQELR
jgi:biuret amidohydrolase